jgi:hypothetical protein
MDPIAVPTRDVCGFVDKINGRVCTKKPGAGTTHEGVGFCSKHENVTQEETPLPSKRMSENYLINSVDPRTREVAKALIAEPDKLYDLREMISHLKALEQQIIAILEEDLSEKNIDLLKQYLPLAKQITASIDTAVKIERSINRYVHVDILRSYTQVFVNRAGEYIINPKDKEKFLRDLKHDLTAVLQSTDDGKLAANNLLNT